MQILTKITVTAAALALISATGIQLAKQNSTELVEYRKEVSEGETVWSICASIATDEEDLSRLVWQTMQDNHIKNASDLQPGQLIVVRVQRARNAE